MPPTNKKNDKNGFSFLMVMAIGFVVLIVLAIYLSSNGGLPKIDDYYMQNGSATGTDSVEGSSTEAVTASGATSAPAAAPIATASAPQARKKMTIIAPEGAVTAEISNTPALRELGLSGRASLGANKGMVFIFPQIGTYGFWMKDMNFSLDMVWIDAAHKVAGVQPNISPETYPTTFFPPKNIQFVLELEAGAAQRLGIATGTLLKFVP